MGFGSLGIWEILIIGIIVLVFFGPNRLPEIARSTGRALREFRRGMNEIQRELEDASGATGPPSRGRPGRRGGGRDREPARAPADGAEGPRPAADRPSEPTGVSPRPPSEGAVAGEEEGAGEEPEAPLDQQELFSGDEPSGRHGPG